MNAKKIGNKKYRSCSSAAIALVLEGKLTNAEIATKVGITPQTVSAAIKREVDAGRLEFV